MRAEATMQIDALDERERDKASRKLQTLESRIVTHHHLASYAPLTLGELRAGYLVRHDGLLDVYGGDRPMQFRIP